MNEFMYIVIIDENELNGYRVHVHMHTVIYMYILNEVMIDENELNGYMYILNKMRTCTCTYAHSHVHVHVHVYVHTEWSDNRWVFWKWYIGIHVYTCIQSGNRRMNGW